MVVEVAENVSEWLQEEYSEFTSKDTFDTVAYVQKVTASMDIASCLSKLTFGLTNLQKKLKEEIGMHHDELLLKVKGIRSLEKTQNEVAQGIKGLERSFGNLCERVTEPLEFLKAKTRVLTNIHSTCVILRELQDSFGHLRRLAVAIDSRDFMLAATTLLIVEKSLKSPSFHKIRIVSNIQSELERIQVRLLADCKNAVENGISQRNPQELITSLDILQSLNILDEFLSDIIQKGVSTLMTDVRKCIDLNILARYAVEEDPTLRNSEGSISLASLSKLFWNRIVVIFDMLFENTTRMFTLSEYYSTVKRDPSIDPTFLWKRYWSSFCSSFEKELKKAAKSTPALLQILQGSGFHRLLRLINDLFTRISVQHSSKGLSDIWVASKNEFILSFSLLEMAYLSRSVSRMLDPINSAFTVAPRGVPSPADVSNITKIISNEIDIAKFDDKLLKLVLKNVSKAINMFVVKAESAVVTDAGAYSLFEVVNTPGMLTNFEIANIVSNFTESVEKAVVGISPELADVLLDSMKNVKKLFHLIFERLFKSAYRSMEPHILKMVSEDGRADHKHTNDPMQEQKIKHSSYVADLAKQFRLLHHEILPKITCRKEVKPWVQALLQRIILTFVHCACLVKPLSEATKLRLVDDMTQLEFLFGPILTQLGLNNVSLGQPLKYLRALRPFIFINLDEIANSEELKQLQIEDVVHHLICRGPDELKLPHACFAMKLAEFLVWREQHTQDDWKSMMDEVVRLYLEAVEKRGIKSFAPEYMTILQLIKT